MTIESALTLYLPNGQPKVTLSRALGFEDQSPGWLDVSDELPAYSQAARLTIHFDDPQQVVDFAAALVEAVLPEPRQLPVIDMGCYPPIHVMAEHPVQHRDLSDAGTDRLIADLRDGDS